jgi:hypothetical protein
MNIQAISPLHWNTATCVDAASDSLLDCSALGEHLGACNHTHRHWITLQYAAENLHGFVAARFVTTLVITAVLISAVGWFF